MSDLDDTERSELAAKMVYLGRQNAQATEELRAGGRSLNPLEILDMRLGVMLDLAFGPIPRVTSAEELAEKITDARLIFEVEWQERFAAALERVAKKDGLVVPKSNGRLHLP